MVDKDARKNGSAGRTSKKWTVGDYLRLLLGLGLLVGLVWYLPGLALAAAVVLAVLIPIMILSERFSGSVGPRIPVLGKVAGAAIVLAFFGGLAWYLYPEDLLSKPLTSLSILELIGIVGWFAS
jgi:hypothetical protein